MATIVKEYEAKGEVILVDAGDRVTGNAYVDDAEQPGLPIIELMNEVGYDVVTLGNHEFDKGHEVLGTMVNRSEFEWVCCNMADLRGEIELAPWTTIDVGGVDICFVGTVSTDGGGRPLGGAASYVDFCFTSDVDAAYSVVDSLPECDFCVLLSHMGQDGDRRLATQTTAYDWIVGGHSHDIYNEQCCDTHISQNNKNLRYVTIADITVEGGAIVGVEDYQIKTEDVAADDDISAMVKELKLSDEGLNSVEMVVDSPATKEGVSNFTIASLATYPYPEGFVPEITIYHYGGVRLDGFEEGELRRVDILNNDPFLSTIYVGEMTPEQLEEFILAKYNSGTVERPDKESHYPYFRSDWEYTIVLADTPDGAPDAIAVRHNLEPRLYRVAMCNYVAENYIDRGVVDSQLHNTDITVREAMLRYARSFKEGYTPDNTMRQSEVRAADTK